MALVARLEIAIEEGVPKQAGLLMLDTISREVNKSVAGAGGVLGLDNRQFVILTRAVNSVLMRSCNAITSCNPTYKPQTMA
jgi:hypothetical protein